MIMSLTKYISILTLSDGIKLVNNNIIIDTFSMFPILRSIYETYSIFNNIYIQSINNDQREYKENLFKLSSLNYRQRLPAKSSNSIKIKKQELLEIKNIKNITRQNNIFKMRLNDFKEKDIFDKEYYKVDNDGFKKSYTDLIESSGINTTKLFNEMYNYLSMMSHPSYIGCLQFYGVLSNNKEEEYLDTILLLSNALMCAFINDYKKHISKPYQNSTIVEDYLLLFFGSNRYKLK